MSKKYITTALITALSAIAIAGYIINTDEVLVTNDEIITTDFNNSNLPATRIFPCTKLENGIQCEYYLTTLEPDTTPTGIIYEITNVKDSVFLSAKDYNTCRETKTEAVCKQEQNNIVSERMERAKQGELLRLKEIKKELAEKKALQNGTTLFNSELNASDITIP